ncbi:hypothetical protein BpHYR1_008821 [Brachionus plicatilis]|uniref:Uncharacterized protein n=1 Tax=Brachionus plicatilis TaxID=10195 RepID=A0A3M7R7K2_BRAPC|nr:hypothetical protein BpHYR1_008821 [Brachionus plicatilis]
MLIFNEMKLDKEHKIFENVLSKFSSIFPIHKNYAQNFLNDLKGCGISNQNPVLTSIESQ